MILDRKSDPCPGPCHGSISGQAVDEGRFVFYEVPMTCASLRPMTANDPRGFAAGPEGVRMR